MAIEIGSLKLFIDRETSPRPTDWGYDGSRLVLAESLQQAQELFGNSVIEVEADGPCVLMQHPTWDETMGEDV